MNKFGEFFDAIEKWAKENGNMDAQIFLEEWVALPSEVTWEEARAMDFSEGLFLNFAEDMATYFQERIQGICTDALWAHTMERGHAFLKAIAETGRQFGLMVQDNEIDVPLSFGDALVRAQQS